MRVSKIILLGTAVVPLTSAWSWLPRRSTSGVHFKGTFLDGDREFDLYSEDPRSTGEADYQAYLSAHNDDSDELSEDLLDDIEVPSEMVVPRAVSIIKKRINMPDRGPKHNHPAEGYDPWNAPDYDWFNCTKFADGKSYAGCNIQKKTAPNMYYKARGFWQTRQDLVEMWTQAFANNTGYHKPRSVCRLAGKAKRYVLCVSWSFVFDTAPTREQIINTVDYAMECQGPRGMLSSQVAMNIVTPGNEKTRFIDTAVHRMLCTSARAKECQPAEWMCRDLWHADKDFNRGAVHANPEGFQEKTPGNPFARGPCIDHCELLNGQDPIDGDDYELPEIPYPNKFPLTPWLSLARSTKPTSTPMDAVLREGLVWKSREPSMSTANTSTKMLTSTLSQTSPPQIESTEFPVARATETADDPRTSSTDISTTTQVMPTMPSIPTTSPEDDMDSVTGKTKTTEHTKPQWRTIIDMTHGQDD